MIYNATIVDLEARLRTYFEKGQVEQARDLLADLHPADIADILDILEEGLRFQAFGLLDDVAASEVLDETMSEATLDLVESMPDEWVADLLEELPMDDAAEILSDLPSDQAEALIELMDPQEAAEVQSLLEYDEGTAGRIMTEKVVLLSRRWTAQETIEYLRRIDPEAETLAYLYTVDENDRLVGVVPLRVLMTAPADALIHDLMNPDIISVSVDTDQEEVAQIVAKYDFFAIPVVDRAGGMAGIITHDDVMDVLEEEFTEDVQRLGGSQPLERPYFAVSIPRVVWKRVGWLVVLFVTGGLLAGAVVKNFEAELAAVVALGTFIPLVTGTGGNAGSQSVATIIRAQALGEVRAGDAFRVVFREVVTGLGVGLIMGAIGIALAVYWEAGPLLALTFTLTLIAICVLANVFAALIPIVAERIGIDPAVISTPFITTVVDASGLFIYFSLAKLILGI